MQVRGRGISNFSANPPETLCCYRRWRVEDGTL